MSNELFVDGPTGFREFTLSAVCQEGVSHDHQYPHYVKVVEGRASVYVEGLGEFSLGPGDPPVLVPAVVMHRVKAVTPFVRYRCTFEHRDFNGQVVQEYVGNVAAYH